MLFYRIKSKEICQRIRKFFKTRLNALKIASKIVFRKDSWSNRWIYRNKIADIEKPAENSKNVEEVIIPSENEKKYWIKYLLNNSTVSKFVTKKWTEVNDLSNGQYSVNKTHMLRSEFYDYSDAYIIVKEVITVEDTDDVNERNENLTFKINVPFRTCISKTNNTFVDNAGDLEIVRM